MGDGTDRSGGDVRWQRVDLEVAGMGCRHAVRSVTARLRDVRGVEMVLADARTGLVTVTGTMSAADLLAAVEATPYRAATSAAGPGSPRA